MSAACVPGRGGPQGPGLLTEITGSRRGGRGWPVHGAGRHLLSGLRGPAGGVRSRVQLPGLRPLALAAAVPRAWSRVAATPQPQRNLAEASGSAVARVGTEGLAASEGSQGQRPQAVRLQGVRVEGKGPWAGKGRPNPSIP